MGISFGKLSRVMQESSPLMSSGDDSRALSVMKAGEDLHKKDEASFWDEFISLCSNTEGMAELLEVSPEKVRKWTARIREYSGKLEKHNAEDPSKQEDKEMIPTGETGAFTTNTDPDIGV